MAKTPSGKTSPLFEYIEQAQGDRPWGAFLDAGTGVHSAKWVAQLRTERWTAVTGAPGDAEQVRKATDKKRRPQDKIIQGNWAKADLLKGELYDTVLADYLLGAIEGFAPYFQAYLFARFRPLTRGRLYITGPEPYVPDFQPASEAGRLVWQIGRFRDACLLLGGDLPYREYPSGWVMDQLKRAEFTPRALEHFDIRYKASFVDSQIDLCAPRLDRLEDVYLRQAMTQRGEDLRAKALELIDREGGLAHGRNYVIVAEPV
ncbi:MAG: class I SAM-dependent methyltransferase [Pseudomonadota bacterium]